jgi:type II secretory pathway pseudopilin PulG
MKLWLLLKHSMQKETKKHVKRLRGFTLVELILVVGTIALVAGVIAGLISKNYKDWKLGSNRSTLLQDGQAAMEQMVRILRQAKAFSAVSQSTDLAGFITFTDVDDTTKEFRLKTLTSELEYGTPGSLSALTSSVNSLFFTCYDANSNILAGSVLANNIQSVGIKTTLTDSTNSFTLQGRVSCPIDFKRVVINEFMYNPPGSGDSANEWVELYNLSGSAINVNGWAIWTGAVGYADLLISHPQFGNGSTIIPIGGYAVITAATTSVYTELITNGGFEATNINSWVRSPGTSWSRTTGDPHGGSYKLQSTVSGATSVYQQITITSGLNSYLFIFWEKTTAPVAQTQITATIRNTSNVILATGYSGQMNSAWTCHTMNLAAYAGQTVRIYFSTNKSTTSGALYLDDISVAASYVNINAVRLGVPNNTIGNGLANSTDTVAVINGSSTVDSVTYFSSWGANGDGKTLSRIDPRGSSNDQSNWKIGPVNGTPGSAN